MKKTILCFSALLLGAATLAHADDDTRAVQQQLKDDGFFFGAVDGSAGKETTDAIRRYQIRNGLDVSGKLDDATRKALQQEGGGSSSASESSAPPPPVVSRPAPSVPSAPPDSRDELRSDSAPSTADQDRPFVRPQTPPLPPAASDGDARSYAKVFRKTPYEIAPPVVQRDTIRRAKARLAEAGYLRGPVDGLPTPDLADALRAYQARRAMNVSGRLDLATLDRLHLLPPMERARRPAVLRGVWVQ